MRNTIADRHTIMMVTPTSASKVRDRAAERLQGPRVRMPLDVRV
jgi:hypothetical protein